LEAMIEWVSYWQTDWLITCSNMQMILHVVPSEDFLLQCQMWSWTRRYWILMQLKKWWFSRMERDIAWKYRCYKGPTSKLEAMIEWVSELLTDRLTNYM
jgi:hypothetical protein